MQFFTGPKWLDKKLIQCTTLEQIPPERFDIIRSRLQSIVSPNPVITVVIAAWNEEVNIVKCLDSLSKTKTDIPFEIIVINNNSTDRTAEVLERVGVATYVQPVQGVGPSRELGQQMAKGDYILSADADCVYPELWVDVMGKTLLQKENVFVYGRFSYLSDSKHPRWLLFLFEQVRNVLSELRHLKRPQLNVYGISLGYVKELGMRVGLLDKNIRGFDGRLCFDMMKYGKVAYVRSTEAKAWTGTRALQRDGNFFTAVKKRFLREIARMDEYFTPQKDHDTKESKNSDRSVKASMDIIKKKFNPVKKIKNKSSEPEVNVHEQ